MIEKTYTEADVKRMNQRIAELEASIAAHRSLIRRVLSDVSFWINDFTGSHAEKRGAMAILRLMWRDTFNQMTPPAPVNDDDEIPF